MRVVLTALGAFLLAGTALVVGTSQLDPGWSAGRPTSPLGPTPVAVPVVPAESDVGRRDLTAGGTGRPILGHLVSPSGGSDTAVVLVAGAGASPRTQLLGEAEALARRGLHAVTYDKARDGYSWRQRDFAALAADLEAVLAETRARTGAKRVGVVAISEGGWVAARAAAAPSSSDFLVLVSAPVVSPLEQAAWMVDRRIAGLPSPIRRIPASILAAGRGLLPYLDEDARPHLARSTVPILALWGAEDRIVPVGTAAARLTTAAGRPVTIRVLPGAAHRLDPRTGWLDQVAAWVVSPRNPPADDVGGVEPATSHGVPTLPRGAWFASPLVHLLGASLAAVTVVAVHRRRTPTKESTDVRT
jgi:pimeloyl-ACP methyl ester carboxylesterase